MPKPQYIEEKLDRILEQLTEIKKHLGIPNPADDMSDDILLKHAEEFVRSSGKASISMLQRKFKTGYSRTAHIMDQLEEKGIVGPVNGIKPRKVIL